MWRMIWAWLIYTWGGLHRYFGNLNNLRREHETAVRYFTRAYEIDPTFHQARLARAVLLWRELGQLAAARADLDSLLVAEPTYAPAWLNRALVAQADGRFQDAVTDLDTYLSLPDGNYTAEATRLRQLIQELLTEE